jgi:hypothetical protein
MFFAEACKDSKAPPPYDKEAINEHIKQVIGLKTVYEKKFKGNRSHDHN